MITLNLVSRNATPNANVCIAEREREREKIVCEKHANKEIEKFNVVVQWKITSNCARFYMYFYEVVWVFQQAFILLSKFYERKKCRFFLVHYPLVVWLHSKLSQRL